MVNFIQPSWLGFTLTLVLCFSEGRGDDPKAEEQRKISANVRKYKKLIAKIRNNKDLDSGTFSAKEKETMMELMREAQNLYKASNTAAELLYDAQVKPWF